MNGIFQAAAEIQGYFETRQWQFAIIGGLAVLRWGQQTGWASILL
jgi:hypothetical protein